MFKGRKAEEGDGATLIAMATEPDHNDYGSVNTQQKQDRNTFSDGITRCIIDFVLVWEEEHYEGKTNVTTAHRHKLREDFLAELQTVGVLQQRTEVQQAKNKICYVLLSAPWSVLCYFAEEISLRVPLEVVTPPELNWTKEVLEKLSLHNPLWQDVPNPPPGHYTCDFRNNKMERFLGSRDMETFFKPTQRHQVLYEILARTPYGVVEKGEVGIDRLVSEQIFTAAFPLHQGPCEQPRGPAVPPDCLSLRQILLEYWARWSCWRRYQPLDHIREYYGEKIALYFAWLGFYTAWLLPVSVVGLLVFMFGIWLVNTDVPARELCASGDSIVMCPLCNICSYWNLSSICNTYKAGLLFDNGGTVFFSVFMSLWAVSFLESWKRRSSTLTYRWDCSAWTDIEERPRPEFAAMAPMTTKNPVTGAEEPYFPGKERFNRTLTGVMVIIVMIAVVMIFLVGIIFYRSILSIIIHKSQDKVLMSSAGRIASISGSVLNLLVILMLSRVYISLAHFLTQWEMHRTQSKYEDMFILKVFIFQFVNFYSSPVYIAFFKGRFIGYPGKYYTLFGIRNEDCGPGGCLIELAQELLVIMVGKQIINNVQEFISPKLQAWWQRRNMTPVEEPEEQSPWERDYQLLLCEGLFNEYLEMVLQFGFITIFVAACPLAPVFALVNNWVEVRLDAQKFVSEYRRPVVERAQGIGIWLDILQVITHLAVITNAFLIAFTTSFLPRLYYAHTTNSHLHGYVNFTLATAPGNFSSTPCRYRGHRDQNGDLLPEYFHLLAIRLTFVIVFEHVVFFIGHMIDLMVPDIPEEVEIKIKREYYMAKEALADNQADNQRHTKASKVGHPQAQNSASLGKNVIVAETVVQSTELRQRKPDPSPPTDSPSSPHTTP